MRLFSLGDARFSVVNAEELLFIYSLYMLYIKREERRTFVTYHRLQHLTVSHIRTKNYLGFEVWIVLDPSTSNMCRGSSNFPFACVNFVRLAILLEQLLSKQLSILFAACL